MRYFFLAEPDDIEYILWEQEEGVCWQVVINWTKKVIIVIDELGDIKMKREGLTMQKMKATKENILLMINEV